MIITDKGNNVISWRNEDYLCSNSGISNAKGLEVGGYSLEQKNSFTILTSNFTEGVYPKEQEKITYKGKKYRIMEVIYDDNNAFIRLICQFEN